MTFKHNGRLHRFAYNWNPVTRNAKPARTSVCRLFWRTIFALFIAWPLLWMSRLFGWVVRIILAVPAFVLYGARPAGPSWRFLDEKVTNPLPFVPISGWPKVNGRRVELGAILGIVVAIMVVGLLAYVFILWVLRLMNHIFFTSPIGEVGFWLIVATITLSIINAILRNTEWWQMMKGFAKGTVKRFCPIVEFN